MGPQANRPHKEFGSDEIVDLLGRRCRALGEFAHLMGDHREALSGRAGPGCLDARIQRQKIGLEGDIVDQADDLFEETMAGATSGMGLPPGMQGMF